MGQAKQRKKHDPSYGKPKLRGLIISSPVRINREEFQIYGGLDHQDLRASLLYWDRLVWPSNPQIHSTAGQDETFLTDSGILYRPYINHPGGFGGDIMLESQALAYMDLSEQQPGIWSINAGENSIHTKSEFETPDNGTLLELYNSLPVPGPSVPLNEIVEFKHKRRDELLAFRAHFENLAESIQSAPDTTKELEAKLKEVDKACANLLKTTREWRYPVYITSSQASFNFDLTKAFKSAVETYTAGMKVNLDQTTAIVSAGAAALASQFKIAITAGFRSTRLPPSPYKYAYHVQRELK
ncbi:DUF6236 family protein [Pseudomonas soli]|uniref:DUF6236 family protein n=1 Tax=Pseudomonas soli TaxID=1306993 RepID=UPI003DA82D40